MLLSWSRDRSLGLLGGAIGWAALALLGWGHIGDRG
jgi:hypothetical protein